MSVEQVGLNQSQRAHESGQTGSGSGATIYASQQFEQAMQPESDSHASSDDLLQQLNKIEELASAHSPYESNSGEIKQTIQSTIDNLIADGTLDVNNLPDVGDGSGLKRLSASLAIDPSNGKVHVLSPDADGQPSFQPLDTISGARIADVAAEFVELFRAPDVTNSFTMSTPLAAEVKDSTTTPASTDAPIDAATALAIVDANPAIKQAATDMALAPQTQALKTTLGTLDGPLNTKGLNVQQMQNVVGTLQDSGNLDLNSLPNASDDSGLKMINAELAADPADGALYRYDATGKAGPVAVGQLPNESVHVTGGELLELAEQAMSSPATTYSMESGPNTQTETDGDTTAAAASSADTATDGESISGAPTIDAEASERLVKLDSLISEWSPENDNSAQILGEIHRVGRDLVDAKYGSEIANFGNTYGGDNQSDSASRYITLNEELRYDIETEQLQVELPGEQGVTEWQALSNLSGDTDAILALGKKLSSQQEIALDPTRVEMGDYAAKLNGELNASAEIPDYLQGFSQEQMKSQAQAETAEWLAMNETESLSRGDFKSLSRSASRYAYAELGLPVKENGAPLYEIERWINATSADDLGNLGATRYEETGEHTSYNRFDTSSSEAAAARQEWLGLNKEQRLDHFGLDVASWERAQPYIQTADAAWQVQKSMKTDYVKIAAIAVGSFLTAGALTAAMPAVASAIGTAGVNAVSTTLVSGVVTGDWEGAVKAGVTSYAGAGAGKIAGNFSTTQVGAFAIEAGINGGIAELNGGKFMDGVTSTATNYMPELSASLAQSMNIQPGTWQQLAFDSVASGVTAEFTGGNFEDGFRNGAARGLEGMSDGVLAEQLEIDNPYLSTLIDAGLNGLSAEVSGGDFEDGLRYTALQQLPEINKALHKQLGAEPDSMLSAMLNAGTNGIGYELSGAKFADGFWNSTADSLTSYVDNMDMPKSDIAQALIEAGAAGVASEMRNGDFGDSFLRVIGTHAGESVTESKGETAGVMTETFMHRLIENGGNVGDALMAAGQEGIAAYRDANSGPVLGDYGATPGINPSETSPWVWTGNADQSSTDESDNDAGIYDPANDFGSGYPESIDASRLVNVGTGYLDIDSGEFSPHMANAGNIAVNSTTGNIDVVTADGTTTEISSTDLADTFRDVGKNLLSRANVGFGLMFYSSDLGSVDTYSFTNPDGTTSEHLSDLRVHYDTPMGVGSIQKQLDDGSWIDSGYQVRRDGVDANSPFILVPPGNSQLPGYGTLDTDELAELNIPPYPNNGTSEATVLTGPSLDSNIDTGEMGGYIPVYVGPTSIPGSPAEPVGTADDLIIQAVTPGFEDARPLENAERLRDHEIVTGHRAEQHLGIELREDPHSNGGEYIDSQNKTYDAVGSDPRVLDYMNQARFRESLIRHALKSNDHTIVDGTNFTDIQKQQVESMLDELEKDWPEHFIRIGF